MNINKLTLLIYSGITSITMYYYFLVGLVLILLGMLIIWNKDDIEKIFNKLKRRNKE